MLTTSRIFANDDAADRWFEKNDAEGVAFEYPIKSSERGQTKHDRCKLQVSIWLKLGLAREVSSDTLVSGYHS